MQYQIETWPEFTVAGFKHTLRQDETFQQVPKLWAEAPQNGKMAALVELFQQTDCRPAGLLGVAAGGDWGKAEYVDYYMAVTLWVGDAEQEARKDLIIPANMETRAFTAGKWAIFQAEGELPDSVQNIHKRFFTEWLPQSGFELGDQPTIECYFPDRQEVWVSIV